MEKSAYFQLIWARFKQKNFCWKLKCWTHWHWVQPVPEEFFFTTFSPNVCIQTLSRLGAIHGWMEHKFCGPIFSDPALAFCCCYGYLDPTWVVGLNYFSNDGVKLEPPIFDNLLAGGTFCESQALSIIRNDSQF